MSSAIAWPPDYHMHTPLCHHAVGEPTDYARAAVRAGLKEIGFSEHSPMQRDDFDDWRMDLGDLDLYVEKVKKARREVPEITIKLAMEVDYIPGHEDWIRDLTARHPWDYLIGSVHYVSDWAIDNPKFISKWRERDPFETWTIYFETLAKAASSGLFDIIGHADLPKKFCFIPTQDCSGIYHHFLQAAKKSGVAMEINTAGLRKECKEMYPTPRLVEMAYQAGVPLTFGSDSHDPREVGYAWIEACQLARASGYRETVRFTQRRRDTFPIPIV